MTICAAVGCSTRSECTAGTGVTLHRFPKDPELRNLWAKAVKRLNWEPTNHSYLCSNHFKEDCFDRSKKIVKLVKGSIPTHFDTYPSYCKNQDEDSLQKWRRAIPRADRLFTYKDKLCELHFEEADIIRYDTFKFPDGTSQISYRHNPILRFGAVPKIFPNCPEWFTKVKENSSKSRSYKKRKKMPHDYSESQEPEESANQLEIDTKILPRSLFSDKNPNSATLNSLRQDLELTFKGSECETDIFLLNYLQHPCLWNKKHPNYNVVEERRYAEKCLMECCGLSSVQLLQTKINQIHTEYNKELHRLKLASQGSKKFHYLPKLEWFDLVHELLGNRLEELPDSPFQIDDNSSSENSDDSVPAEVDDESIKKCESAFKRTRTIMTQTDFKMLPILDDGQEIGEKFTMFGQHVASQLSKLTLNEATILQESIQKLILEARLRETEANPSPSKEELESVLDNYNAYLLFNKMRKSMCDSS